ncbi:MAG: tetratricopeptide repeat protein [Candidatus Theseobacter exili]|nr:tetratricopeptide repeat protein [Candidatus Theseobacter exili]
MRAFCIFIVFFEFISVFNIHADILQDAEEYKKAGDFKEAERTYLKAKKEHPNNPSVYSGLGESLFCMGRYDESMRQFWEVLRLTPEDPEAHLWMARLYSKRKFFARALREAKIAVSLGMDSLMVDMTFANVYRENGNSKKAIVHYEKVLEKEPDNIQAICGLGNVFMKNGEKKKAYTYFEKALKINPYQYDILLTLGNLSWQKGIQDKALEYYLKAEKAGALPAEVYLNMGATLDKEGKIDEALEYYQKAADLSPDDFKTRVTIGIILLYKGKIDEAISQFQNAVKFSPYNERAHSNLGKAYMKKGMLPKAVESFQKAIQINPGIADFHTNLGIANFDLNDYMSALIAFEKSSNLKNDPEVDHMIGLCYLRQEMSDQAIEYLAKAAEAFPDDAQYQSEYAQSLSMSNLFGKADEAYVKAVLADSDKPYYVLARVDNLIKWNKPERAVEILADFIKKFPDNSKGYLLLGEIYEEMLEKPREAVVIYKKFIELFPSGAEVQDVQYKIKRLKKRII